MAGSHPCPHGRVDAVWSRLSDGHAGFLRFGGSQPLVRPSVCGRLRARLALRVPAGGLAFWRRRSRMGSDSRSTVANEGDQPLEIASEKRLAIVEAALARRMRSRHMTVKPASPSCGRRPEL